MAVTVPVRMIRSVASHACALVAGIALTLIAVSVTTVVKTRLFSPSPSGVSGGFDGALRGAMIQMDAAMCFTSSGDADRDFTRAMIPHHQGAVEMARLELLFGRDVRLRRLAQGIIVEQSQEIALLRSILASDEAAFDARVSP
jgi:hypothetical protein